MTAVAYSTSCYLHLGHDRSAFTWLLVFGALVQMGSSSPCTERAAARGRRHRGRRRTPCQPRVVTRGLPRPHPPKRLITEGEASSPSRSETRRGADRRVRHAVAAGSTPHLERVHGESMRPQRARPAREVPTPSGAARSRESPTPHLCERRQDCPGRGWSHLRSRAKTAAEPSVTQRHCAAREVLRRRDRVSLRAAGHARSQPRTCRCPRGARSPGC